MSRQLPYFNPVSPRNIVCPVCGKPGWQDSHQYGAKNVKHKIKTRVPINASKSLTFTRVMWKIRVCEL